MKHFPTILVLGATGMLGRVVYTLLKQANPITYGTSRKPQKNLLLFRVAQADADFKEICGKLKINVVINCIGEVSNNAPLQTLISINSLFPHTLFEISQNYDFKIIHVSTDAVYPSSSKRLTETSLVGAQSIYAASKLLGEVLSSNTLNIRTSLISFDPIEKKGLLEYANTNTLISGYDKHMWTGCTTLQLAQLCKALLSNNTFNRVREQTPYINFAPLGPLSKYSLIKIYLKILHSPKKLQKKNTPHVKRHLTTNYFDLLDMSNYTTDTKIAIKELIEFEETYGKK